MRPEFTNLALRNPLFLNPAFEKIAFTKPAYENQRLATLAKALATITQSQTHQPAPF